MTLGEFSSLCHSLASTRSRLTKTALTAEFLRRLEPEEAPLAVAFLTARPFPASDPRVLEVSWAMLSEVLDAAGPAAAVLRRHAKTTSVSGTRRASGATASSVRRAPWLNS